MLTDGELTLAESGGMMSFTCGMDLPDIFCIVLMALMTHNLIFFSAITEYLCDTYDTAGALHPLSAERALAIEHRYWLHYSEGSLGVSSLCIRAVFYVFYSTVRI